MSTATKKRYWLRRRGTNVVAQWTRLLATDIDMYAVTEEEAKACQQRLDKDNRAQAIARQAPDVGIKVKQTAAEAEWQQQIKDGLIPPDAVMPGQEDKKEIKAIEDMSESELVELAGNMKIILEGDSVEAMRQCVRDAQIAAAAPQKTVVLDTDTTTFAPENDDLEDMDRTQLFAECDKWDVKKYGKDDVIRYHVRRARKDAEEKEKKEAVA